jgi:hypothetical protein
MFGTPDRFLRHGNQLVATSEYGKQGIYRTNTPKGNPSGKAVVPFQVLCFSVRRLLSGRCTFPNSREKAKPLL